MKGFSPSLSLNVVWKKFFRKQLRFCGERSFCMGAIWVNEPSSFFAEIGGVGFGGGFWTSGIFAASKWGSLLDVWLFSISVWNWKRVSALEELDAETICLGPEKKWGLEISSKNFWWMIWIWLIRESWFSEERAFNALFSADNRLFSLCNRNDSIRTKRYLEWNC